MPMRVKVRAHNGLAGNHEYASFCRGDITGLSRNQKTRQHNDVPGTIIFYG